MENALREYAILLHGEQKYGDEPYVKHLDDVVAVLKEFGYADYNILAAGYLHDVLEDTDFGELNLKLDGIPSSAIEIIKFCTDETGKNRKERKERTYEKVRACREGMTSLQLRLTLAVRLADRIANVRNCIETNNRSLYAMYYRERDEFKNAYWVGSVCRMMWKEYDRLMSVDF